MLEERLAELKEIAEIQGTPGNFNYNPHMYGVYVGLELALSIMEGRQPVFLECPENWADEFEGELQ